MGKLLEILLKRDNELVPLFLKALVETDQRHIAKILGYEGLCELFRLKLFSPFCLHTYINDFVERIRKLSNALK